MTISMQSAYKVIVSWIWTTGPRFLGTTQMSFSKQRLTSLLFAATMAVSLVPAASHAQAAGPLIKQGACPSGYFTQGGYCVPRSGARTALPKAGGCPSGYYTSGDYCLAGKNAKTAIEKVGSGCPSGWYSSGHYCLRSR